MQKSENEPTPYIPGTVLAPIGVLGHDPIASGGGKKSFGGFGIS